MAIEKLEIYQQVMERIQTDMKDLNSNTRLLDLNDQPKAAFLLAYMLQQNERMIAALKKLEPFYPCRPQLSFRHSMDRAVQGVKVCVEAKTASQDEFLRRLSTYLIVSGLLSAVIVLGCATPVLALVGPIFAFAMTLASAVMLIGFSVIMGSILHRYLKSPGYEYPKLDENIVKNWDADTRISGYPRDNGACIDVTVKSLKWQFSNQVFFRDNKTLAALVEENYQSACGFHGG